jgi:hypothetical protein
MAEKRMVHRNITKSDKLLHITRTRGWRAFGMYMAHMPYLDKAGRMKANPLGLKGTIWEVHPVTVDEIAGDLDALAQVGLIRLYRTPKGEIVMQYAKFDEEHGGFNKPHPNEPESDFPDPDSEGCREERVSLVADNVLDNVPDNVVTNVPTINPPQRSETVAPEYELEKEKEIEKEVGQKLSSTLSTRVDPYGPFLEAWNYHRGSLGGVRTLDAKRKRAIDTLRKEHGIDALDLFEAAVQCVAADDFWLERGYGLDNLLRPGRVLEKAEKFHANRGMSAGDRKLATTAATIARAIGGLDA